MYETYTDIDGVERIIKRRRAPEVRLDDSLTIALTTAQAAKLRGMGGAKWVRAVLDAAPSRRWVDDEILRLQDLVQRQGAELLGYRRIAELKKEWERREYARVFGSEDRPAEHPAYGSLEWRAEHDAERKRSQDAWEACKAGVAKG